MAQTKFTEIKELSIEELTSRLRDLKQEALTLRLQQATGQLENTARRRLVRRCLLYTSPSPRDLSTSRMPSSA